VLRFETAIGLTTGRVELPLKRRPTIWTAAPIHVEWYDLMPSAAAKALGRGQEGHQQTAHPQGQDQVDATARLRSYSVIMMQPLPVASSQ
jgi:hypothetical protein